MRLAWLTDLHFDWVPAERRADLYRSILDCGANGVAVGGDIGHAGSVVPLLLEMAEAIGRPLYFVLGNHDFYGGSIESVRGDVARAAAASRWLHYLTSGGAIELAPDTALIGHDGWADGRLGDYWLSQVMLNDYLLIEELKDLTKAMRLTVLNRLGEESVSHVEQRAREALSTYRRVVVLTHVPPFRESCWHEGQISNGMCLPHFACGAMGERLAALMRGLPDRLMTVLCGHTHSAGYARVLPNLEVHTAGAEYGSPGIARVFDLDVIEIAAGISQTVMGDHR